MSAAAAQRLGKRTTLGLAEMAVSADPNDSFITYALGSCLGITLYDPVTHVGGLLHVMMPSSSIDPAKAKARPGMFIDTGVPRLFHSAYRMGAVKQRLIVKVAGGAQRLNSDSQRIASRNIAALRNLMWRNQVLLKATDVGGSDPRTMTIRLTDGYVSIKTHGKEKAL